MARPIDWTGAPSRTEIDLMTMHAIRYGEWLCRTFPTWEQTLPACWIEHDDVVAEVFALKCHADLAAASPTAACTCRPSCRTSTRPSPGSRNT